MPQLVEPVVVARVRMFLLLDNTDQGYALVDSQFDVDEWASVSLPTDIADILQPMTFLQMGGGRRPDLLVADPNPDAYVSTFELDSEACPVAAVEAKGLTDSEGYDPQKVNTIEAISKAAAHLEETNLAFAAFPKRSLSESDRVLARKLNVGLILVSENAIKVIEQPTPNGLATTPSVATTRYNARIGAESPDKFKKNHPKNGLGFAVCVVHGNPASTFREYVIEKVSDGQADAEAFGLVTEQVDGYTLTERGREAVRSLIDSYGSIIEVLEVIDSMHRTNDILIEEEPRMGLVAREILLNYPPTRILIGKLEEISSKETSLRDLASSVINSNPEIGVELFIAPESRPKIIDEREEVQEELLDNAETYHSKTYFHYKAMMVHTGILAHPAAIKRGTNQIAIDSKENLVPETDPWVLRTSIPGTGEGNRK